MADPTWDDFDIEDETVTEEEAKDIETGSVKYPVGLYLCEVVHSKPKQIDFKEYSTIGVTLKFKIHKILEIQKRPPTENEISMYVNKSMFDDVAFSHEYEKDGMAKRRKYVALKLGLIKPGEILRKSMWQHDVIGKFIILRVVPHSYTKKSGELVETTQIGFFDGYETAEQANKVTENAEAWDEI